MKMKYELCYFNCQHVNSSTLRRNSLEYCSIGLVLKNDKDQFIRYYFCDECFDELIGLDVFQGKENDTNKCHSCSKDSNKENYYSIGFKMRKLYHFCENCWSKIGGDFLMEELERGEIKNNVQIK